MADVFRGAIPTGVRKRRDHRAYEIPENRLLYLLVNLYAASDLGSVTRAWKYDRRRQYELGPPNLLTTTLAPVTPPPTGTAAGRTTMGMGT